MADTSVAVTEGAGANIDTRTESTNGNHRQVVVLGDPATNAGVAPVDATNGLAVDVKQSALPSGAATSAKQDTVIGHLDGVEALLATIDADTGALAGAVAGSEVQVDVVSSALPSGASTSAKQDTVIGHLDGVEGLLTTIDADTGNISTKVDAIAAAVSGSEVQVDVVTMPTVTVTATNLDVQSGGADLATSTQAGAIQTAVELIDDTVRVLGTDTYTEATSKGVVIGAVRRDADTTLVNTTNEFGPLQMDANGRLKTEVFSGETLPVSLTSTTITGTVAVTQSGTWDEVGINDSGNSITVDNGGTFAVQVDGAALTALQKVDDPVIVDDAAFTPGSSSVMMAGFEADESSTDSVNEGDGGAARMTLDRKVIVTPQPHTAGGCSIFRSLDLDETEEDVKTSAGQVYGYFITNLASSTRYVKFYNATAANVTVGTTTPVITIPLEADQAANVEFSMGIAFDTAICVAATTGLADNDTGAPGANEVVVNIFYK